MVNHEHSFATAKEFVEFFQTHDFFRTTHISEANVTGRGGHIYRGQCDARWELLASAFRDVEVWKRFNSQYPGAYDSAYKVRWLGSHLHTELRASFIFLQAADKLGIETPIDYGRVRDHYDLIFAALNNEHYDFKLPFPNHAALEDLALAQHHGIPTRLIDWTESPMIACYFAAYGASSVVPARQRVKSDEIAVTCLRTFSVADQNEVALVSAPRHRNNFLQRQQGIFSHLPKANAFLLENDRWPTVEDIMAATPKLHGALKRYTLPTTQADNLLRILFDYDITRAQLMPTLDNIANEFAYASKLFP